MKPTQSDNTPANVLGGLIRRTIRILAVVELLAVLLYMGYRSYVVSARNTNKDIAIFWFSAFLHLFNAIVVILASQIAKLSMALVELGMVIMSFATVFEIYNLTVILDSRHAVASVVISILFIVFNIGFAMLLVYIRFGFTEHAWNTLVKLEDAYNLWGYLVRKAELKYDYSFSKWLVATTLAVEATTLVFYVIFIFGIDIRQDSGYVFLMHALTIIAASIWMSYEDRKADEVRPYYWLLTLSCVLFLLDLVQLIEIGSSDIGLLVAMRGLLWGCTIAYILAILVAGVNIEVIPHHIVMFYIIQYGLTTLVAIEVCLTALYFVYATALDMEIQWSVFVHVITAFCAAVVCVVTQKDEGVEAMLWAVKVLLVVSFLMFNYDLFMVEVFASPEIDIPLLLISISYSILSVVILAEGATTDQPFETYVLLYFDMVEKERLTNAAAVGFVWPEGSSVSNPDEISPKKRIGYYKLGADKIYFYILVVLRKLFILDAVLLYIMILVMSRQIQAGDDPAWYQWFYILHALTIVASLMAVTFQFDVEIILTFLVISAVICAVVDIFLICFLIYDVPKSLITVQVLFIAVDVAYAIIYALITFKNHQGSFSMLKFMTPLHSRITLNKKLQ